MARSAAHGRRRAAPKGLVLLCLAAAAPLLRWGSPAFAAPAASSGSAASSARWLSGRLSGVPSARVGLQSAAGSAAIRPKSARPEGATAAPPKPEPIAWQVKDKVLTVAAFPFALVPLWAQLVTAEHDMDFKGGFFGAVKKAFVLTMMPLGALTLFVPLWMFWALQLSAGFIGQVSHPVRLVGRLWKNRGSTAVAAVLAALTAACWVASGTYWQCQLAMQAVGGLVGLYILMSLNEYTYHRYCQHLGMNKMDLYRWLRPRYGLKTYRGDGHVEHHRETLDDMTLDTRSNAILDSDPYRGTAFNWVATLSMSLGVLPQAVIVLKFMAGWSWTAIATVFPAAMLLHALMWNGLHPQMHGLPIVPLKHGAPSWILARWNDSAILRYLRENHEGHHRIDGAHGNYNVCCPFADHIFGTHVGRIPMQVAA